MAKNSPPIQQVALPKPLWKKILKASKKFDPPGNPEMATAAAAMGSRYLHACGYNFAFQARSHEAPYWPIMREWQSRAELLFRAKDRSLGKLHGDGDPPTPPGFFFNSALLHKHAQLMWIAYEGRQGYVGYAAFMPLPTEWEIIDDYLGAVQVFLELGVEEHYARANEEVFG